MPPPSTSTGPRLDLKDFATGLILVVLAGLFAGTALTRLALGNPANMGPGLFPLLIAVALAAVGIMIALRAFGRATQGSGFVGVRGGLCTLGAPLIFAMAVAPLGFVPAIALATLVAAFGSREITWHAALLVATVLTAMSSLIFVQLLQMPVALFGTWFWP